MSNKTAITHASVCKTMGLIPNIGLNSQHNNEITYTITAVSTAINLTAGTYSFPKYSNKKPSDIIKQILFNKRYGLQDVFYGMHSESEVL